ELSRSSEGDQLASPTYDFTGDEHHGQPESLAVPAHRGLRRRILLEVHHLVGDARTIEDLGQPAGVAPRLVHVVDDHRCGLALRVARRLGRGDWRAALALRLERAAVGELGLVGERPTERLVRLARELARLAGQLVDRRVSARASSLDPAHGGLAS